MIVSIIVRRKKSYERERGGDFVAAFKQYDYAVDERIRLQKLERSGPNEWIYFVNRVLVRERPLP